LRGFRLTDSIATGRVLFPEIFAKPVVLEFDQRQGSSSQNCEPEYWCAA
jgi:hypothetical protein